MIYLDNAATSYPKPPQVVEEVLRAIRLWGGNPGRSGHRLSLAAAEAIYNTRCLLAGHIGVKSETHIIFTSNATHALNLAIHGRAGQGDHVLLSDLEHNSVRRPITHLAREGKITYSVFSHKGDVLENIRTAIRPNTRMLVCTHASNVTGFEFPAEAIGALCQIHGIYFILDASQSIGHKKLNVDQLKCDALCAPGHKGLLGIQGSGFLYLKSEEDISPLLQGGSGSDSASEYMPRILPDMLEAGTLSTPAIVSMGAGIRYLEALGIDACAKKEASLCDSLKAMLSDIPSLRLYSSSNCSILSFLLPHQSSEETAAVLDEIGVCVRGGLHCSPLAHASLGTRDTGLVRVSFGCSNTLRDAEMLSQYIHGMAK